jgi:hypothetical protein
MDEYISSSIVFDKSHTRFSILNIYDEDEDDEDKKNITYYKIPVDVLKKPNVIKEEAFNPSKNNCCIIS